MGEYEVVYPKAVERRFQRMADRLGLTVEEVIALATEEAVRAGLPVPKREGRVLAFKALKRRRREGE